MKTCTRKNLPVRDTHPIYNTGLASWVGRGKNKTKQKLCRQAAAAVSTDPKPASDPLVAIVEA